jgi:hypothetical protein
MRLPQTISSRYRFITAPDFTGFSNAKTGIYRDLQRKRRVFVKIDTNRARLDREMAMQKFFSEARDKLKAFHIRIPRPIGMFVVDDGYALVSEYYQTVHPKKTTQPARLAMYRKIFKFLNEVNRLPESSKLPVGRRTGLQQLTSLAYYTLASLYHYPAHARTILRALKAMWGTLPLWVSLPTDTLIHGDLNVANVLESEGKILLCDCADVMYSHRYAELGKTTNAGWFVPGFQDDLYRNIISDFGFNREERALFHSFVLFNLIQHLSDKFANDEQNQFYLDRLDRILSSDTYHDMMK